MIQFNPAKFIFKSSTECKMHFVAKYYKLLNTNLYRYGYRYRSNNGEQYGERTFRTATLICVALVLYDTHKISETICICRLSFVFINVFLNL